MNIELTTFLALICVTYLIMNAEPIEWLKRFLLISNSTRTEKGWHMGIITLFNCSLCFGFWIGLIHYQDIYTASLLSLASEITAVFMARISTTLK